MRRGVSDSSGVLDCNLEWLFFGCGGCGGKERRLNGVKLHATSQGSIPAFSSK